MHRTYSMRQSRAPTHAQLQNPPPPPSSTKGGRLFGKANFGNAGHTFRRSTAGAFGPDLAKKLSQLVKMEKNLMRSMELVGRERREVARQLSIWGEECDEDVSDITDKLGVLIYEIGELEDQFIDRYDQYRVTIKSIRNIEASVQPSRDRKQKITDQIAQLKYKDPNSPKIVVLEQELVRAEAESLVAEAQLSNITREKLKSAFTFQFDALLEHCEKLALIAGYGKHLLDLVDDTPVTPGETREAYDGYDASKSIIQDCEEALVNWVPARAAIKSRLSVRSRSRSARRAARARGEGVSLTNQDRPLKGGSGIWVPAAEHEQGQRGQVTDDDEYEDIEDDEQGLYGRPHHQHHRHHDGEIDGERRNLKTGSVNDEGEPGSAGGRFYSHNPVSEGIGGGKGTGVGEETEASRIPRGEAHRDVRLSKELGVPVERKEGAEQVNGSSTIPSDIEKSSYARLSGAASGATNNIEERRALERQEEETKNKPERKVEADSGRYTDEPSSDYHHGTSEGGVAGKMRDMGRKLGVLAA